MPPSAKGTPRSTALLPSSGNFCCYFSLDSTMFTCQTALAQNLDSIAQHTVIEFGLNLARLVCGLTANELLQAHSATSAWPPNNGHRTCSDTGSCFTGKDSALTFSLSCETNVLLHKSFVQAVQRKLCRRVHQWRIRKPLDVAEI